jgi:adenylate cyclase
LFTLPPLDDPITPEGARNPLLTVAFVGVVLYGFAAFRYARLYRRRTRPLVLAVAVSYVLLAEAMFAVALSRNWHVSWWEWHLLMLVAVALVAWTAWSEWQREGSTAEIWSDLYEERTLGRREELSVLFADLQGFTSYSERTPEAEVQSMLNQCLAAVTPSVQAFGGQARIIGDAVMAVFRSPGHEEAAARAGLAFQEAAGEIAQEHPEWPHWRVGINSGAAYLGLVEAYGVKAYTPTCDIVNVGARLEAQARAGEVVIGEGTRAALGARAEVEDLGEFPVKGKERPVRAFVLRGLAAGGDEGDQRLEHQKREPDA